MIDLKPFQTEIYFDKYEFTARHLLAASDCETVTVEELLKLAGEPVQSLLNQPLGYTESWGSPDLRLAIAKRYELLTPDHVLVLSSPIEGLYLTSQVINRSTIVLLPAYDALKNLPRQVLPWQLKATGKGWALDFEALDSLLESKPELLVVNFPHNPTGFTPSSAEWQRLLEWASAHQIRVFCDEMYRGLTLPGNSDLPSAVDCSDRALILGGLSKSYGLPGLRCGWLASRDRDLLERLHDFKLYTSLCPPGPVEFLAKMALKAETELLQRCSALVAQNLELADQFFERWSQHFVWRRPLAGSIGLVELRGTGSAKHLCERLCQEHGLVLLPTTFMGTEDRFVRFGFGRASFPEDLAALESLLGQGLLDEASKT